ncbi:MAG TPA: DUF6263 family protein [Kofleriaceae bacterium]|nr:DUF6263 family protein [Kofleriaceae bacterium]
MAAVLVLAVACKKSAPDSPSEPPDLQMVSAGSEPRKLLRYRIPKSSTQGLEVAADMTLTAGEMGGPLPTIVMTMLVAVEDVGRDQRMKLRTTIVDATARERDDSKIPAAALSGQLDTMKGIAIESMLSPEGRLTKPQVEGSKQLTEEIAKQLSGLTASFENVMMPLPNEPVGVGAVWRNSRPIEQNGMKLTSVNTFTLTAIDGDKLTFTIDTDVHGDDQTVKQGDLSVEIKDITGTGTGHGTLTLTKLDMTNELTAEFRSQMKSPGDDAPTRMTISSVTHIKPSGSMPVAPAAGSGAGSASGSGAGNREGSGSGSAGAEESAGSGSGSGRVDE